VKNAWNWSILTASLTGAWPRPSNRSTDRQNGRGEDWLAVIVLVQNASRLRFRSSRYDRRWVRQASLALAAAEGSGFLAAAAAGRSSRRVSRLAVRHSASNHGSDGRGRRVIVRTGTTRSGMSAISVS
jgi:hypothetical protein